MKISNIWVQILFRWMFLFPACQMKIGRANPSVTVISTKVWCLHSAKANALALGTVCVCVLEECFPHVYAFVTNLCWLTSHIIVTSSKHNITPVYFRGWVSNVFSCPLASLFPLHILCSPLCPVSLSLSGWNSGGGQPGLCRWPTSLPWWCSAMTRCLLAAVTIGDRQVHQVLLRIPLPTP